MKATVRFSRSLPIILMIGLLSTAGRRPRIGPRRRQTRLPRASGKTTAQRHAEEAARLEQQAAELEHRAADESAGAAQERAKATPLPQPPAIATGAETTGGTASPPPCHHRLP